MQYRSSTESYHGAQEARFRKLTMLRKWKPMDATQFNERSIQSVLSGQRKDGIESRASFWIHVSNTLELWSVRMPVSFSSAGKQCVLALEYSKIYVILIHRHTLNLDSGWI